jgi:hypothetical protein
VQHLQRKEQPARKIMTAPVVTVEETADIVQVAELLSAKRIKRVPVVRHGRVTGIISRADLLKTIAQPLRSAEPEPSLDRDSEIMFPSERLQALTQQHYSAPATVPQQPQSDEVSAHAFRDLVARFEQYEAQRRHAAQNQVMAKHEKETRELLTARLSDEAWHRMLSESRAAAHNGRDEHLLLEFPCELCTDHGRSVNAPDPNWPATLRGIAAEVFMRWKNELRPQGFGLHARVLDFPDGVPGRVGLFLAW